MQEVARVGLDELQQKVEQRLIGVSPQEIVRLAEVGAAIERKARGDDLPDRQFTKINVIFGDVDEAKLEARLEEQPVDRQCGRRARQRTGAGVMGSASFNRLATAQQSNGGF